LGIGRAARDFTDVVPRLWSGGVDGPGLTATRGCSGTAQPLIFESEFRIVKRSLAPWLTWLFDQCSWFRPGPGVPLQHGPPMPGLYLCGRRLLSNGGRRSWARAGAAMRQRVAWESCRDSSGASDRRGMRMGLARRRRPHARGALQRAQAVPTPTLDSPLLPTSGTGQISPLLRALSPPHGCLPKCVGSALPEGKSVRGRWPRGNTQKGSPGGRSGTSSKKPSRSTSAQDLEPHFKKAFCSSSPFHARTRELSHGRLVSGGAG